jgi:uncharacterized membrane protein
MQQVRDSRAEVYDSQAVAVFDRHEQAEAALRDLQRGGIDVRKTSIVARDPQIEQHPIGFYTAGARAGVWGKWGAFWGSLVGILFAPAFLWIPGIGFVVTGGLLGSFIMGTLEGAAAGAAVGGAGSALVGGLTRMGIPKEDAIQYEESIRADKFVVIVAGTTAEATTARSILESAGSHVDVHQKHLN